MDMKVEHKLFKANAGWIGNAIGDPNYREISLDMAFKPKPWQIAVSMLLVLSGVGFAMYSGWKNGVDDAYRIQWTAEEELGLWKNKK